MNLLKGPVDDQRVGRTTCNWNLSPDPEDWSPEHDCPNRATHHIMWGDWTMSQVCDEHLLRTVKQVQDTGATFVVHAFRDQCSQEGAVWLMPANICTDSNNAVVIP